MGIGKLIKSTCSTVLNSPALSTLACAAVPALAPAIQAYHAVEAAKKAMETLKALKKGGLPALMQQAMQQAMQAGLNQAMQKLVPQDVLNDVVDQADKALIDRTSEAFRKAVMDAYKTGLSWDKALIEALPKLGSPEVQDVLAGAIQNMPQPKAQFGLGSLAPAAAQVIQNTRA